MAYIATQAYKRPAETARLSQSATLHSTGNISAESSEHKEQIRPQQHKLFVIFPLKCTALQIILDLCIPEIELANTRSQISFIFFQSHS